MNADWKVAGTPSSRVVADISHPGTRKRQRGGPGDRVIARCRKKQLPKTNSQ
jgi:hypothetical protein